MTVERKPTRQYQAWYTGDGATTEFALPKNVVRPDDLTVTVQGLLQRIADATSTHDFEVRGVRPAYGGESNMIRFTVAPPNGVHIGILIHAS